MNISETRQAGPGSPKVHRTETLPNKLLTFLSYYLFGLLACIYLFTIGFLRGRNRTLLYKIAAHFGPFDVEPNQPKPLIPTISASQLLPPSVDVHIMEPVAVEGNVTLLELMIITQLTRQSGALNCFEIGTFDGRTALNIAANCGADGKVYTLDLPQAKLGDTGLAIAKDDIPYIAKDTSGGRFQATPYKHKIEQLYGDSASFDYSPYTGRMDLVFVDGAHSCEYVLNDSWRALELLRERKGIILWHDYDQKKGVTDCLNRLYREETGFRGLRHIEGTALVCLMSNNGDANI